MSRKCGGDPRWLRRLKQRRVYAPAPRWIAPTGSTCPSCKRRTVTACWVTWYGRWYPPCLGWHCWDTRCYYKGGWMVRLLEWLGGQSLSWSSLS